MQVHIAFNVLLPSHNCIHIFVLFFFICINATVERDCFFSLSEHCNAEDSDFCMV